MSRARQSIILSSVLGFSTLVSAGVSSAIVPQAEPVDPGSALAVVTAGPSPINVYDELTITVTCPAPPDPAAGVRLEISHHGWTQVLPPTQITGNSYVVVYPVPVFAGFGLTAYGSCVSQGASASTSNGVVIDVIPLQVPTPFAIPVSITVSPTDVHPGDVVHVDVRCSGAPPTADMGVWTSVVGQIEGEISLMPFVTVAGNGYTVDFPVPAGAALGRWRLGAFCDLSPDVVIPGAPPYDFTRYYTVSAAPTQPSTVPTLPPTL